MCTVRPSSQRREQIHPAPWSQRACAMQFWNLPGEYPQGSLQGRGLDSYYFIRAKMSVRKNFSTFDTDIKINLNDGDGLFAVKIGEGNPEGDTLYAEALIDVTCAPRFSFLGQEDALRGKLVFDGGEAELKTCVLWKVRTSL